MQIWTRKNKNRESFESDESDSKTESDIDNDESEEYFVKRISITIKAYVF